MPPLLDLCDADIRSLGEGELVLRDDMIDERTVRACCAQMRRMDADGQFSAAGVGASSKRSQTLRSDRTTWADDGPEQPQALHAFFGGVRQELNEAAWMGLAGFSVQLAIFDADGGGYVAHRDAIAGDPARRATAILYLNPDWHPRDGGCLRIRPPSGSRDVAPIGGRLVLFRSDCLLHEVLPTTRPRMAATAWFRGRASNPLRNAAQD